MVKKRVENAKKLIMDTAIEVFAEYGYDGARVDEIAFRAGVNKSLIYYHYEGKEHLLKEMIQEFFDDYEKLLVETVGDSEAIEMASRKFISNKEPQIRIILIESLKNNDSVPPMFSMVEKMIETEKEMIGRYNAENYEKRLVSEFFVNMVPRAMYICFKEDWCSHFKMDCDKMEDTFYDVVVGVHEAYIKDLF